MLRQLLIPFLVLFLNNFIVYGDSDPDLEVRQENEGPMPPNLNQFLPITPNGPFYGFPFDTSVTWNKMLPFSVSGKCEAGKLYVINKPEDVLEHQSELECLYNTGVTPFKVPEGALYGTVLSAINTRIFNQFVSQLWKGMTINKTECNGNQAFIGWNNVLNQPLAPFMSYIGNHNLNLAPGEYENGRPSMVIEYGLDVTRMCPEYRSYLLQTLGRAGLRGTSWSGTSFPLNQAVDVVRYIGKQDDGAGIYLGKTYLKDPYRDDHQAVTIAYFLLVSFDKDANPLSIPGLPATVPSAEGFKYMLPGIVDLFFRMNPIDNLLTTPVRTFNKLLRGALKAGTSSWLFAQSLPYGMQNIRSNARNYQNRFYNDANIFRKKAMNKEQKQNPGQSRDDLPPMEVVIPIVVNKPQPPLSVVVLTSTQAPLSTSTPAKLTTTRT